MKLNILQNFYCPIFSNPDIRLADGYNSSTTAPWPKWTEFNFSLVISWFNKGAFWPRGISKKNNPLNNAVRRKSRPAKGRRGCHIWRCKLPIWEHKSAMNVSPVLEVKAFTIIKIEFAFRCLGTVQSYHLNRHGDVRTTDSSCTETKIFDYCCHQCQ